MPPSGEESQERQGTKESVVCNPADWDHRPENPGPLASDQLRGWKQLDAVPMLPV